MATITAARTFPRNISKIAVTRAIPIGMVLLNRIRSAVDQRRPVVERNDLHTGQQVSGLVQLFDFREHVLEGRERFLPLAKQHDPLNHVVFVFPLEGTIGIGDLASLGVFFSAG